MSLTELSFYLRRYLPFAILFFLIFLILFYIVKLFFLYLELQKVKPAYTNPIFGKIQILTIKNASSSAGLKFRLDTIEGKPVTATDSAKVFYIPEPVSRFGYREKIYLIAKTLGFNTDVTKYTLNGDQAELSDNLQKLTVDIRNFNFSYQYSIDKDPTVFTNAGAPTTRETQQKAAGFLQKLGRYPNELSQGDLNTIFFHYDPKTQTFKPLDRNTDANVTEVDLYRPGIDTFSMVSSSFFNSNNYTLMVFGPGDTEPRIIKAQIQFFEKSDEQIGYYPVKTGEAAYNDLKNGRALVISNPENKTDITIKSMNLAYYDPDTYQSYLQPVYVFIGEGNFVAYVPAITDEYLIR